MDFLLSDEEKRFKARFEKLCREKIAPRARLVDKLGWAPDHWRHNVRILAEDGFMRMFHPKEHGGTAASGTMIAIAIEALAKACASTALLASSSSGLAGAVLSECGSAEHHERWLKPVMAGEKVCAVGIAEEGALSDQHTIGSLLTRGTRGYVLNGMKSRVTVAPIADVALMLVKTDKKIWNDPAIQGREKVYVVLDTRQRGVQLFSQPSTGVRGMPWGGWRCDDVQVAEADILQTGKRETPHNPISKADVVEWGQVIMSCSCLGVGEAALEACTRFVRNRPAFGMDLVHLQSVHARLADMRVQIDAARLLVTHAVIKKVRARNAGEPADSEMLFTAKINASDMVERVTSLAMRLHGGFGFSKEYDVERMHRDSQAYIAGGGANDRLIDLLGGALTGVNALHHHESTAWLNESLLRDVTRDPHAPEPWAMPEVSVHNASEYAPRGVATIANASYTVLGVSQHGLLLSGTRAPAVGARVHVSCRLDGTMWSVEADGAVTKSGTLGDGSQGFIVAFQRPAPAVGASVPAPVR